MLSQNLQDNIISIWICMLSYIAQLIWRSTSSQTKLIQNFSELFNGYHVVSLMPRTIICMYMTFEDKHLSADVSEWAGIPN